MPFASGSSCSAQCSEPGLSSQPRSRTPGTSAGPCCRTQPQFFPLPSQRCLWRVPWADSGRGLAGTVLPAGQALCPTARVPGSATATHSHGPSGWGSASTWGSSSPSGPCFSWIYQSPGVLILQRAAGLAHGQDPCGWGECW